MRVLKGIAALRGAPETRDNVLVPTMGALHAGHLALIRRAQELGGPVLASIFVNPIQFVADEASEDYPRSLEADMAQLRAARVDAVFLPRVEELFPDGPESSSTVNVAPLEDKLCGQAQPGHFRGVATIVTKLFNIARPRAAVFGEKDYQQLLLIRKLTADLNFPVRIEGVPTVREADGLACSSRNLYLDAAQRRVAPELHHSLHDLAAQLSQARHDYPRLREAAWRRLEAANFQPEYLELRNAHTLEPPSTPETHNPPRAEALRLLVAARLGAARLIDNLAVPLKPAPRESARAPPPKKTPG